MIILSGTEETRHRKQAIKDDVVKKYIEDLDTRVTLGEFNQNQMGEISNEWDWRRYRRRDVDEGYFEIGLTLRRSHLYEPGGSMKLFPDRWKLPPMFFNGLMHMWFVGMYQNMIPPF